MIQRTGLIGELLDLGHHLFGRRRIAGIDDERALRR